ncbi:VPS35 endosomal protein-sorting factor-like isoform X2 [Plutella xylostella]|uniref:VPS35 endosomal protein-sorting factor-like isoform X2 n=1 Tax=Plutella xylostella TaxID=51655 RepID=UPI00203306FE|nr:VPS35 endosomal protein-sorting factor-like isoform X2 [Plutella xylostella]
MPAYYEWTSLKNKTPRRHEYPSIEVTHHPLKPAHAVTIKQSVSKDFMEDLNKWSSPFEVADPLMRFEQMNMEEPEEAEEAPSRADYAAEWRERRAAVLARYTTADKLSITSSYLPGGEKALIRQVSTLNEKVRHRLEQLDEDGAARATTGLSQHEFVTKINVLNEEIKKAWNSEQRVKAFKIAIQCSKLLQDTAGLLFYPSKAALIHDTLDMFGELVFQRLREKSYGHKPIKTVHDIDPALVPEPAKETCLNWVYKMASIRELLPRLYMEMALLPCVAFVSKTEIKAAVARLTVMIRGMGSAVVAAYLRLYLTRVAARVLSTGCEEVFYENLNEFVEDYPQIFHPSLKKQYTSQSLPLDKYLSVYLPAAQWLLHGARRRGPGLVGDMLRHCDTVENSELLLYCVLTGFDSATIIQHSAEILDMIQQKADTMVMVPALLTSLGTHLCSAERWPPAPPAAPARPPPPAEALATAWWRVATTIAAPAQFLQVVEPWIEFACKHLSTQHVNMILRGTIRQLVRAEPPRAPSSDTPLTSDPPPASAPPPARPDVDALCGPLMLVLRRLVTHVPVVTEVFLMDAFMPLVELAPSAAARAQLARPVLAQLHARHAAAAEQPVAAAALLRLACILHDNISAVTVEDEIRVVSDLISRVVYCVQYEDFEQQLNFYVQCRSDFIKLDAVLVALVHCVNALSARVGASRSSPWLQRACAAYCSVTAPALRCPLARAPLLLLSGQAALLNNCVSQAEANFKALVGLLPDIPEFTMEDGQRRPTHARRGALLSSLLATLLVLPDNVDSNCKAYVLSGVIKTLERIHWRKTDTLYSTALLHALDLLCAMAQEDYAYHIESVLSNDVLYGSDEEFIQILEKYSTNICQELLLVLKALAEANETRRQASLSLELFWRVARRADLEKASMFALATNLWMLYHKLKDPNTKLAKSVLAALDNDDPASRRLLKTIEEATASS